MPHASHELQTLTMLHVEDSYVDAMLIAAMLKNIGRYHFDIKHCTSLQQTYQGILNDTHDLILLDLCLPDSKGVDTLINVRQAAPKSPIVVITGTDAEELIRSTIQHGAQDYLVKGQINTELLRRAIQAAINRKQSEEALKTSEERYQLVLKGSSDGLWDWTIKTNKVIYSERFLELIGHKKDELSSTFTELEKLIYPKDKPHVLNAMQEHLEKKIPYKIEYRLNTKNNGYRWFLASGQATWDQDGNPTRMAGSLADINDRKQAEYALKKSEERLRYALESANDGFWDWDIKKDHVYFSPRYEIMLGWHPGSLAPDIESWKSKIHPDDLATVVERVEKHLRSETPLYSSEHRVKTQAGEWLWILARGRAVEFDDKGSAIRMIGTQTDITEHKKIENALRVSEERFQLAVDGVNDGVWDWQDISKDEEYWSPRFKELLGYAENEIKASYSTFIELLHPDDATAVGSALEQHFKKNQLFNIEYRLRVKSGEYRWFRAKGKATRDIQGNPVRMTGSISDVTEYKKSQSEKNMIEAQLRQAQKLEAIGQLAAGVAHEINTPTQFVGDNIRFLQDALKNVDEILRDHIKLLSNARNRALDDEYLTQLQTRIDNIDLDYLLEEIPTAIEQSLEGAKRIGSIVRAMKDFSHPGSVNKELADINKSISNTITVSRNEWKYVAEMETDFDPNLPMVECLPGELNQTILNLIVNAAHAIADNKNEKGKIKIATQKCGEYVEIIVSDNGLGIPEEIQSKIFNPFFTTKEVGKGTGQGLAIAHRVIVDKHQGELKLNSTPGKGTTFSIKIPIHAKQFDGDNQHEKAPAIC